MNLAAPWGAESAKPLLITNFWGDNASGGSPLLTAAASLFKRETVCTFGNLGIGFVSSHCDAVKSAVTFAVHVVLAGYYIAFDRRILHNIFLLNSRTGQNTADTRLCSMSSVLACHAV